MKYRILLAEDEPSLNETIRLNLELEGYKVSAVSDGKSALKTFKSERFNLVILDVMMPEKDGIETCQEMRQIKDLQKMKFSKFSLLKSFQIFFQNQIG